MTLCVGKCGGKETDGQLCVPDLRRALMVLKRGGLRLRAIVLWNVPVPSRAARKLAAVAPGVAIVAAAEVWNVRDELACAAAGVTYCSATLPDDADCGDEDASPRALLH